MPDAPKEDLRFEDALAEAESASKDKLGEDLPGAREAIDDLKADSARAQPFTASRDDIRPGEVSESDRKEHAVAPMRVNPVPRMPSQRIVVAAVAPGVRSTVPDQKKAAAVQVIAPDESDRTVGGKTLRVQRAVDVPENEHVAEVAGEEPAQPDGSLQRRWVPMVALLALLGAAVGVYFYVARSSPDAGSVAKASSASPGSGSAVAPVAVAQTSVAPSVVAPSAAPPTVPLTPPSASAQASASSVVPSASTTPHPPQASAHPETWFQ